MMIDLISEDIKKALKNKDKEKLILLRSLKTALRNQEIELRRELTEEESINILKKEVKSRQQAAELYVKGGRQELADNELKEAQMIEEYLPKQLSREEIEKHVLAAISETGATSMKDMGMLMKLLKDQIGNQTDGKLLSSVVREKLQ